jgi:hypothetical protein
MPAPPVTMIILIPRFIKIIDSIVAEKKGKEKQGRESRKSKNRGFRTQVSGRAKEQNSDRFACRVQRWVLKSQ